MKQKQALLIIDVQNEYFDGFLPVTYPQNSFENIKKAMLFAKSANTPIIAIRHGNDASKSKLFVKNTHAWGLHSEIEQIGYDYLVDKTKPSSFFGTNLEQILQANNTTKITICGYMTQQCCDTTARYAYHMGYDVDFLSDANGTLAFNNNGGSVSAKELHDATLVAQAVLMSSVLSTDEWIENNK
jgi:nicotinamidase-related amidase